MIRRRRRALSLAGVAALALALGIGVLGRVHPAAAPQAPAAAAAPNVELVVARAGSIERTVSATGRVGAAAGTTIRIVSPQSGLLAAIDVRVGERVAAGAPLAELARGPLAAALAQATSDARSAEAAYAQGRIPAAAARAAAAKVGAANAKLANAAPGGAESRGALATAQSAAAQAALKTSADRDALVRVRRTFDAGVSARRDVLAAESTLATDLAARRGADVQIAAVRATQAANARQAQADLGTAGSDLATARAQSGVLAAAVASARAKREAARLAYASGILRAPADGVVTAIDKHVGEAVDATAPVIELGTGAAGVGTLAVTGVDAARIAPGDLVRLRVGSGGRPAIGRVRTVVPSLDAVTQTSTVEVDGVPGGAIAGDALGAEIVLGRARGVVVPAGAITEDPQTGNAVVFVRGKTKDGDAFAPRTVTVRASDAKTAVLGGGLRVGERIAASGGYALLAPSGGG